MNLIKLKDELKQFYVNVVLEDSINSTNLKAWELAKGGLNNDVSVVCALSQSEGRGRYKRDWFAPLGGGLWASWLFSTPHLNIYPQFATAFSALAIVECLQGEFNLKPGIRWPNDIIIKGKKIAGIITETKDIFNQQDKKVFVIGAGVNLNICKQDFPEEISDTATSLFCEINKKIHPFKFLQMLSPYFIKWLDLFLKKDFIPIEKRWQALSLINNRSVFIRAGNNSYKGIVKASSLKDGIKLQTEDNKIINLKNEFIEFLRLN